MEFESHYRKLERMFLNARINTEIFQTTTVQISDSEASIGLEVSGQYHHSLGAMHGAVYFKLLDDAAFFAVNSVVTDVFVLTTSFNIHFLRPVSSGKITAKGIIKFQSKNLFTAEASLMDEKGREIAFGTGSFVKSKVALSPEIGYV